jgi:hypothetical protein
MYCLVTEISDKNTAKFGTKHFETKQENFRYILRCFFLFFLSFSFFACAYLTTPEFGVGCKGCNFNFLFNTSKVVTRSPARY